MNSTGGESASTDDIGPAVNQLRQRLSEYRRHAVVRLAKEIGTGNDDLAAAQIRDLAEVQGVLRAIDAVLEEADWSGEGIVVPPDYRIA